MADPKGLYAVDPCWYAGCLMAPPDLDGGGGGILWIGNILPSEFWMLPDYSLNSSFIPQGTWSKNPAEATRLWDLAIAAALRRGYENERQYVRFPAYITLEDECIQRGSLILVRHYQLWDQDNRRIYGGVVVRESNAVVLGEATSKDTEWFSGNFYDYVGSFNQAAYNYYQTFEVTDLGVGGGFGAMAVYVKDPLPHGALAIETSPRSIKVNGVEKSGLKKCGPNVPHF